MSAAACADCGGPCALATASVSGMAGRQLLLYISPCFMSHPVRSAPCQNSTSPVKVLFPLPNRLLRAVVIPDKAHFQASNLCFKRNLTQYPPTGRSISQGASCPGALDLVLSSFRRKEMVRRTQLPGPYTTRRTLNGPPNYKSHHRLWKAGTPSSFRAQVFARCELTSSLHVVLCCFAIYPLY